VLRGGRGEPAEETPSTMRWGHGRVNVLSFGHGAALGPATHVFDNGEGGADAVGIGCNPFPGVVRCPLEAGWRVGVNCAEYKGQLGGKCRGGSPFGGGFSR
jgi:hypothetical protein